MAIFRKSIWQVYSFKYMLCLLIFMFIVNLYYMNIYPEHFWGLLLIFIIEITFLVFLPVVNFFYIELREHDIIFHNSFITFWKRKVYYKDIKLVHVYCPSSDSGHSGVRIWLKNGDTKFIITSLVKSCDYYIIAEMLSNQGVVVEGRNTHN